MTRGVEWPNAYARRQTIVIEINPQLSATLPLEGAEKLQRYLSKVLYELREKDGD